MDSWPLDEDISYYRTNENGVKRRGDNPRYQTS